MKICQLLFLLLFPVLALAQTPKVSKNLEKPASRVVDDSKIFDTATTGALIETLKAINARNKISGYVVAFDRLDKSQENTLADQLRKAWITEKIGFIVLYNRNTDKISISLTTEAFYMAQSRGPLENLGKKIDSLNEYGPIRGIPQVVNLLVDQIRLTRPTQIVYVQEEKLSPWLILIPFFFLLLGLGYGLFRFFRYLASREIFRTRHKLVSRPIKPVLGSVIGGINTAQRKY